MTLAEAQAARAALQAALAKGERSVQFSDRAVTYRSADELRDAIAYYDGLIARLSGGRKRQVLAVASKGFD